MGGSSGSFVTIVKGHREAWPPASSLGVSMHRVEGLLPREKGSSRVVAGEPAGLPGLAVSYVASPANPTGIINLGRARLGGHQRGGLDHV